MTQGCPLCANVIMSEVSSEGGCEAGCPQVSGGDETGQTDQLARIIFSSDSRLRHHCHHSYLITGTYWHARGNSITDTGQNILKYGNNFYRDHQLVIFQQASRLKMLHFVCCLRRRLESTWRLNITR